MFSRNYSRLLEINAQLDELIPTLSDPVPTDDQLFHAQKLLGSMVATTEQMDATDDGYAEIMAIVSRLEQAVITARRFAGRLDVRWRTTVERALHVLNSVISSRLSDRLGDSNVRQCIKSLDALLDRRGPLKRPSGSVKGRSPRAAVSSGGRSTQSLRRRRRSRPEGALRGRRIF